MLKLVSLGDWTSFFLTGLCAVSNALFTLRRVRVIDRNLGNFLSAYRATTHEMLAGESRPVDADAQEIKRAVKALRSYLASFSIFSIRSFTLLARNRIR